MFFYTQQNTSHFINENIELNKRYNLDMMNRKRNRGINKYNHQYEKMIQEIQKNQKNQEIQKNQEKQEKIKSLKLAEPKFNRWNEDIFEQINLEEQKKKIKELKLTDPIQIDTSDASEPSDINDWVNDWIEKDNNICV